MPSIRATARRHGLGNVKLLLITFELDTDSPVLAWQARVATQLARSCKHVVVLTHKVGAFDPQPNVTVVRLPLMLQRAPARWLGARWLTNILVWRLWKQYRFDAVFIHMNMEWTYRLSPAFRALRLPVLLWYAHGSVTRRLWLAHRCATAVVTSTTEGFRLRSDKVRVIGQGIDTAAFSMQLVAPPCADIITVSRISARKRIELLIDSLAVVKQARPDAPIRLRIIGSALNGADRHYERELRARVHERSLGAHVAFVGQVPMTAIAQYYASAFVHVNVSRTGSMDKTVLEALACGCPVLTSNEAFADFFRSNRESVLLLDTPDAIAARILDVYDRRFEIDRAALRQLVDGRHDVASYCDRIVDELRSLTAAQRSRRIVAA
jgi:glycosyltransferase involved in cell wall biosynthesis